MSCRFSLKLSSWVSHAGIFTATIKFNQPLSVAWYNASGARVPIGAFQLQPLHVHSKRAYINQTVAFNITDEAAFSQFTQAMITQPNFTWHLSSEKLDVQALKFPTAHGLHFNKDVTLKGMDNFAGNVEPNFDALSRIKRRLDAFLDLPPYEPLELSCIVNLGYS